MVWELVSDPAHLPRWWPGVERVEDATRTTWTTVLLTRRGRAVRADYTRVLAEAPRRLVWRQEVDETPFERFLAGAETEIAIEAGNGSPTRVEIESRERLRGVSSFGGAFARRAARRRLDGALRGLVRALGEPG